MNFFNVDDRAHSDRTATGSVRGFDSAATENLSAGWKVWTANDLEKFFEQLLVGGFWVL